MVEVIVFIGFPVVAGAVFGWWLAGRLFPKD